MRRILGLSVYPWEAFQPSELVQGKAYTRGAPFVSIEE